MISSGKGRKFLLEWINKDLGIRVKAVEELGKGDAICLIINQIYPNKISINSVITKPTSEDDFRHNFRLVKTALKEHRTNIFNSFENIIKLKFKANLELLQWIYSFYQKNKIKKEDKKSFIKNENVSKENDKDLLEKESDPVKTSQDNPFVKNDKDLSEIESGPVKTGQDNPFVKNDESKVNHAEIDKLNGKILKYKNACVSYEKEIQFYYQKLVKIEKIVKTQGDNFVEDILQVLYEE